MSITKVAPAQQMRKAVRPSGYFALSFGSIVGSGWVLVLGDWLKSAGPGGATLGFILGGLGVALICICFAELAARMPHAGGEFLYALETLGPNVAFAVGWFLTLFYVAICAFEGIALTVLIQMLLPDIGGALLYNLVDYDVTLGGILIGVGGALAIGLANYLGIQAAIFVQKAITYTFIAIAAFLIIAGLGAGDFANAQPLFASVNGESWITGTFWIFALCAMFLSGFQASVHAIEERHPDTSIRSVVIAMLAGLLCATIFYCLIIISASSAAPWQETAASPLAAADAFDNLFGGGWLRTLVLIAATISLIKTWNATLLIAARLVFAQARLGFLPAPLSRLHPRFGAPALAIILLTVTSCAAVFLGRGAILPIVNMCSMCIAINFSVAIYVLYRRRLIDRSVPEFIVPGGNVLIIAAGLLSIVMAAILIYEPLMRSAPGTIPIEWTLIIAWAVLGFIAAFATRKSRLAMPPYFASETL
jgi:basic amino acid/polyamine antiporter, APA family